ncbi:MAG: hypothetical protein QXS20_02555 [Candidatus Thorarchaeota archaeon]
MNESSPGVILPVLAVQQLETTAHHRIYQAVPHGYALASHLSAVLESVDSRDIEFMLECHLPIRLYCGDSENEVLLLEELAIFSGSFDIVTPPDLGDLVTVVESAADLESLLRAVGAVENRLDATVSETMTIPGLLPEYLATDILSLADWPTRSTCPAVVIVPSTLKASDLDRQVSVLRHAIASARDFTENMSRILGAARSLCVSGFSSFERAMLDKIERLDLRILRLRSEVESISERLRASETDTRRRDQHAVQELERRRIALERDETHRRSLGEQLDSRRAELMTRLNSLEEKARRLMSQMSEQESRLRGAWSEHITAGLRGINRIMVPFVVVGYSEKGVLKIVFRPPSIISSPSERGRKRVRVSDNIVSASKSFLSLSEALGRRTQSDVALLDHIRRAGARSNILSLKQTRDSLREGLSLLVAEGILRKPQLLETERLLSRFPETTLPPPVSSARSLVIPKSDVVTVSFAVTDETGHPVVGAKVTVDGTDLVTDGRGISSFYLAEGKHHASLSLDGLMPTDFEFDLTSGGDVVIPVVLRRLGQEMGIELLVERIRRRAQTIDNLRKRLLPVIDEHRERLLTDPENRHDLETLLSELGYDPDRWISNARNGGGKFSRLLTRSGRDSLVMMCMLSLIEASRSVGGMMHLEEVLYSLQSQGVTVTPAELERILNTMKKQGLIHGVVTLDGTKIVDFIPVQHSGDPEEILKLAAKNDYKLTAEVVVTSLGWTMARARRSLDYLVEVGTAKVENLYSSGSIYHFPGLKRVR